ncbi:MAG: hypothetical protein R2941_11205 [Desulfobacterales bacterium]
MQKMNINISLDKDLANFAEMFAAENSTSVAEMFTQYLLALKHHADEKINGEMLSNPVFQKAMADVLKRLQDGTAVWHTYDEVFGD